MSLSAAALDRLHAFAKSGGHVLFLDHTPTLIAGTTIRAARAATPADFSWAIVETSAQLSATPTPGQFAPPAPPAPQDVPPAIAQALTRAVPAPDVTLDTPDTSLRYIHRQLKDATVYLFFNESDHAFLHSVTFTGKGKRTEVWDPQTATVRLLPSTRANNFLKINLALEPYEARVVVVR
jgi:hypothetical protein